MADHSSEINNSKNKSLLLQVLILFHSSLSPSSSGLFRSKAEKMSSGDWMCGACEHINFKKRDACQRCRCPKFASSAEMASYGINKTEVLAGDWYCCTINCGAHNYASRTSCYKCGSIKNDYYGMIAYEGNGLPGWKSGDWKCNRLGCGLHNYANRMECYKCKMPRDFGGAI